MPIPLYLDRGSVIEAIADDRDTAVASQGRTGANVRGAVPDAAVAKLARSVVRAIKPQLRPPGIDVVLQVRPQPMPWPFRVRGGNVDAPLGWVSRRIWG